MPFGLKCVSNSFIRAVQQVLQPVQEFCNSCRRFGYIFRSLDGTLGLCLSTFSVMRDAGLTLKLKKCDFARQQVTFVGHVIGSGKHVVEPSKVACVETIKPPTTKKEVRQLLGFFSRFCSYIKNFAQSTYPITELTKKGLLNQIKWADTHQQAFEAMKKGLCDATNAHVVEYGQPCGILTDSSEKAIGCCLLGTTRSRETHYFCKYKAESYSEEVVND